MTKSFIAIIEEDIDQLLTKKINQLRTEHLKEVWKQLTGKNPQQRQNLYEKAVKEFDGDSKRNSCVSLIREGIAEVHKQSRNKMRGDGEDIDFDLLIEIWIDIQEKLRYRNTIDQDTKNFFMAFCDEAMKKIFECQMLTVPEYKPEEDKPYLPISGLKRLRGDSIPDMSMLPAAALQAQHPSSMFEPRVRFNLPPSGAVQPDSEMKSVAPAAAVSSSAQPGGILASLLVNNAPGFFQSAAYEQAAHAAHAAAQAAVDRLASAPPLAAPMQGIDQDDQAAFELAIKHSLEYR